MNYRSCTLLLLFLAVVLSGCKTHHSLNAPDELSFQTEADLYRPGDEVEVLLSNGSDQAVGYNICFAFLSLEQRREDVWERIPVELGPEPNAACTAQLNGLAPGESAESTAYLPADLAAGTYRLTADIEVDRVRQPVETNPFDVQQ